MGMRAAAKSIRRIKRTALEMERQKLWEERLAAKDEVIKARGMEAGAYRRALENYVALENEGLVPRIEKPTNGEYSEIAEALVDQYVPGMLKGAAKAAIRKNKDKINQAVEKLVTKHAELLMKGAEERGEIKRLSPEMRKELV